MNDELLPVHREWPDDVRAEFVRPETVRVAPSDYANTMMVELGETLHFAAGSDRNLKLTTPENLETFRAYLALREREGEL